ncbi:hypothetical protein NIES2107_24990 [Nostoc carneum NIES-2107]|nr:hypothetical protein NIES2107_24990 [Nostoc carneum NIES-2107]
MQSSRNKMLRVFADHIQVIKIKFIKGLGYTSEKNLAAGFDNSEFWDTAII